MEKGLVKMTEEIKYPEFRITYRDPNGKVKTVLFMAQDEDTARLVFRLNYDGRIITIEEL